ncbi:glycosyltransferase [Phaeovulum sp. W22_SRMD_FR3]|uniref:glycosyltransferase n=1 Tax=Phaeovulum sp. W22_SRMD_FR3 TaxID=3240274 RepID=UPI003F9A77FF
MNNATALTEPPVAPLAGGLMITWKRECYRSMATSRSLGVPLELISRGRPGGKLAKAWGYVRNIGATISCLMRRRPKAVICLNQPPFLPMVCALYCKLTGAPLILDFHSGALTIPYWRPFVPFYRRLVRKAPFTLVHNRFDGEVMAEWGGRPIHMIALPQSEFPGVRYAPRAGRPLIFFVCSFAEDEPIDIALNAMRAMPEVDFVISGNYRKRGLSPDQMPANIRLAGFMDYADYLATMAEASAMLTLSTRAHIMQMAVHEAMTIGTPVVTNTSSTLEEVLGAGGILTEIDAPSLVAAMRQAIERQAELAAGMAAAKPRVWQQIADELAALRRGRADLFAAQ